MAVADKMSHAEARLAKPSQASQLREGLTNGIGYFYDGRGQAQGLTTGCATGYIQFVTGPVDRPTRGGDQLTFFLSKVVKLTLHVIIMSPLSACPVWAKSIPLRRCCQRSTKNLK